MTSIFNRLHDRPPLHAPPPSAREEQAFYAAYVGACGRNAVLGGLAAAFTIALVLVAIPAASHGHETPAAKLPADGEPGPSPRADRYPVTGSPQTVFVDGPTGFVFVYTEDGWKFVRGSGDRKP